MVDRDSSGARMSIAASSMFPGFRFCPTDHELISYYLRKKLDGDEDSVQIISELELCTFEPWDLPEKSFIKSNDEWFFFSRRGRKYPNGSQNKRATKHGYWKVTGNERQIESGQNVIGTKRTLVFYVGRAPKGQRTEWIIHEYCINDKFQDSLVVCRLKRNTKFHASDSSNKALRKSGGGVSEGVTVQRSTCVPIQDRSNKTSCKSSASRKSSCGVSEGITIQRSTCAPIQDRSNKASRKSSSSRKSSCGVSKGVTVQRSTCVLIQDRINKASRKNCCGVSEEGVTVQRSTCVPIQDKEVGCSFKKGNNNNSSPSTTAQIESSRIVANEANPKASSGHSKVVDEVGYYAEINLVDIINLDETAL
ncbi:NAC domain-containing protein 96-like [Arachis hypogaea]|uniref:NAC domain-containing protein 96-like n=1 Tax=Arachis hypogaea TaxID=3818 RepID=UPI000DEC64B0|nr:NAC domain-containing protein 40-like [Arachis hypogaea]